MSANNQTLIREYKDKWYVFSNIMAESWCTLDEDDNVIDGRDNELELKNANGVYNSRDDAYEAALKLDAKCGQWGEGTEYGVQFSRLCKDDSKVHLIE